MESNFVGVSQAAAAKILEMSSLGSDIAKPARDDERSCCIAGILHETTPQTQAEAIRLRYLEGQSLAQIAAHMGKNRSRSRRFVETRS